MFGISLNSGVVNLGYKLACENNFRFFSVSAVIFKGKKIISYGVNCIRGNHRIGSTYKRYPHSQHAEASAVFKFNPGDLKGYSIFICRVNTATKNVSTGFPCARCQKLLYDYGIKYVYCTMHGGNIEKFNICDNFNNIEIEDEFQHDYRPLYLEPGLAFV